jgi:hypothetical protein
LLVCGKLDNGMIPFSQLEGDGCRGSLPALFADFRRLDSQSERWEPGEYVSPGVPLVTLIDLNGLWVHLRGFAGIVALAVIVLAATTWALHHKTASAVPIPTDAIYQARHLNLF